MSAEAGFPRAYVVVKWLVVALLVLLCIVAAAFWTLILGDFAGAGFRVRDRAGPAEREIVITPECAWPYRVDDPAAKGVCRIFYDLAPEQRDEVVRRRR
jgi:hypothetical protein